LRNAIVGSLAHGRTVCAWLLHQLVFWLASISLSLETKAKLLPSHALSLTSCCQRPPSQFGLFVYAIAVATVGRFSGYAGSLALTLIAVPVVMRTTENMLRLVPGSLREAAFALGAPRWKVSLSVTLRAAKVV
jgi:phosphate transport system permease protein